jgi:glyoxylase-like metal-dependent hydrolase (beta-lactamase superfamily II)/rhodanese-related sulfurtransferase
MIFEQFYLGCLSHASYLIGDEQSGIACIVDPQRDIDQYLQKAKEHNLDIAHVVLTHIHADFVPGHLELAKECAATIYLSQHAKVEYPVFPLKNGDIIALGNVCLKILETPGHTPESVSILVFENEKDKNPQAVLTGDTLFIGDVGRPDLLVSTGISAADLAATLYDSLHNKLMTLPDETMVYPAHGAGSFCGKNLSSETCSTIGAQKKINWALKPMSKEQFVKLLTADLPPQPKYFTYDAELNKQNRLTLGEALERALKPISLGDVCKLRDTGAQILDTRDPQLFSEGHIKGSINVGLGGKYATFAGCILNKEKPIIIVCDSGKEKESALRLGRIGFDNVVGFLQEGIAGALKANATTSTKRHTTAQLAEELTSSKPPLVLDVRTNGEREQNAIEKSLHIPLHELVDRIAEIPTDREIVVTCAGGYRSSIAASYLRLHGANNVSDLIGGMMAWIKSQPAVTA